MKEEERKGRMEKGNSLKGKGDEDEVRKGRRKDKTEERDEWENVTKMKSRRKGDWIRAERTGDG